MKKFLLGLLLSLSCAALAQVAPQTLYGVFPPNSAGTTQTHYKTYVMTQTAISGVTDSIQWASIENTADPSTQASCGTNSDVCQQDSLGFFHTYSWTTVDTQLGTWFSTTSGWGTKKVNILVFGQGITPNTSTPKYVNKAAWATSTGATQHYVNNAKDTCSSTGGAAITSAQRITAGSNVVTVTQNNSYTAGQTVWVYGFTGDTTFNIQTQAGTPIISANSTSWTYASTGTTAVTAAGSGLSISDNQSYNLPTDATYKTGYKALIAAVIYHFNNSPNLSQVGYIRFGRARGGEAILQCPDQIVNNQVITVPSPGYTSQANSKTTWLAYDLELDNYIAGLAPHFQVLDPLNPGWTVSSPDYSWPDQAAANAYATTNALGQRNGFGSQGLQMADIANFSLTPPPYCAADWCSLFNTYWLGGLSPGNQPLELQQIDCSDPTAVYSGVNWVSGQSGLACGQLAGGKSKTGDFRVLLPFVKLKHATLYEIYQVDLLLAYDPTYCVLSGSTCGIGSVNNAIYAMRCVGPTGFVDSTCPNGVGGDGSYKVAMDALTALGTTKIDINKQSTGLLLQNRLGAGTITSLGTTCTGTANWNIQSLGITSASITITGSCTLTLSSPAVNGSYLLFVTQGSGGSHTLALGSGCTWKIANGGSGVVTPTTTAGALDVLSFTYDGANCNANFVKNFN